MKEIDKNEEKTIQCEVISQQFLMPSVSYIGSMDNIWN